MTADQVGHRILWLTENYLPQKGGMALSCERIVRGLRSRGVVIDLVHLCKKARRSDKLNQKHGSDLFRELGEDPPHGLNLLWNELSREPDKYRAIVSFGAQFTLLASQTFSSWLGIPLFICLRGNDFDTAVMDPRKRPLMERAYTQAEAVFCVSAHKSELIRKLFPSVEVVYTPNGIEADDWRDSPWLLKRSQEKRQELLGASDSRKVIGLIGDLKAKKGCEFFVDTLIMSGLAPRFSILLVGLVGEEIRSRLEEWRKSLDIHLYEYVGRHELIEYYRCCDFIAIPSYYDGMPNVLLEAGCLEIPVLCSNTGGMRDLVEHDQSGLLFEPGDPHELRYLFQRISEASQTELNAMSRKLKEEITLKHNVDQELRPYLEYLNNSRTLGS